MSSKGHLGYDKLLLATRNKGKMMELKEHIIGMPIEILTMDDIFDIPEVEEDGDTFLENAKKKAVIAAKESGYLTLADDSGLAVDALNGLPGVHSARFAGDERNDDLNNVKLLEMLKDVPPFRRTARFVCAIVIATPEGKTYAAEGLSEGVILDKPRGTGGFGYDPLFYVPELKKTFAELDKKEKNLVSHRGRALKQAAETLKMLIEVG